MKGSNKSGLENIVDMATSTSLLLRPAAVIASFIKEGAGAVHDEMERLICSSIDSSKSAEPGEDEDDDDEAVTVVRVLSTTDASFLAATPLAVVPVTIPRLMKFLKIGRYMLRSKRLNFSNYVIPVVTTLKV